ncbi:MAG: class I SAM-dependent methyltransferase, partial [Pedobacter sp.]
MQHKWFKSWFNSPYYHILYSGRNDEEAEFFMRNLIGYLKPGSGAKLLDIACGKGRHAIFLRKMGFDVTGIDLSEQSINAAKKFEDEKLHFFVHDMRKLLYINYFDISFNLFTSFGYFETEKDNLNTLKAFAKGINHDGTLVIDYFNAYKVIRELKSSEIKEVKGIEFNISKSLLKGKIIKNIDFQDNGIGYSFSEKVSAFT